MTITWALFLLAATAATASRPPSNYIVGGEDASIYVYPSAAQIEWKSLLDDEWTLICGATILNERWLLTAAHCFVPFFVGIERTRIRAGATRRGEGGQVVKLKSYIVHPDYAVAAPHDSDIALVELERSLVFSDAVNSASIFADGIEVSDNEAVYVVGWGDTVGDSLEGSSGNYASVLQEVTLFTENIEECKMIYEGEEVVTDNMLCAGNQGDGGRDACAGDSGGPAFYLDGSGDVLVGVVSWGSFPCGSPVQPAVFTKVSAFTSWILSNAV
ncbi:hypothetical protein JYU34_007696 [Plutella xylostella]|uniref:Peptidase S1 domain-containing protein n=1 Tax=Plutella xylostella TaxID=51655 RepID=A0ABQ7QR34_PLUXY|nr:hypothetical protein JYU34_007696 [Plutella xylostella]